MSPRTTEIRQSREKRGGAREKKKCKSAKRQVRDQHSSENKADINTEQPQAGAQESRQESLQGHKWNGDHRGKAESNLLDLLETLFILSRAVFSTTPLSKSIQTHFQDKATSNLHRLFNQLRQISLQDNTSRLPNSADITIQGTTWLIVPRKVSDHFFGQGERAKAQKGLSTLSLQVEKAQGSG